MRTDAKVVVYSDTRVHDSRTREHKTLAPQKQGFEICNLVKQSWPLVDMHQYHTLDYAKTSGHQWYHLKVIRSGSNPGKLAR